MKSKASILAPVEPAKRLTRSRAAAAAPAAMSASPRPERNNYQRTTLGAAWLAPARAG